MIAYDLQRVVFSPDSKRSLPLSTLTPTCFANKIPSLPLLSPAPPPSPESPSTTVRVLGCECSMLELLSFEGKRALCSVKRRSLPEACLLLSCTRRPYFEQL